MAIKISGSTIIDDSRNIVSAGSVNGESFVGDGSNLTGIVTSIVSGAGISIDQSTGQVTISSDRISLSDLSVTQNAVGTAALSYDNISGVFSYTPPDLSSLISLSDLSVTQNAAGTAALSYSANTGVFTYTPPDLSSYLTSVTANNLSAISIDALSDVDTSSTAPTDGQALLWNNTNSKWEPGTVSSSGGGGISLTDLSITTAGSASGGGSLSYDNTSGVFTFTPADTSGGGGGSSTFLGLSDTPASFTASKYLAVNSGGTAIEFVDAPSGGGGGSSTFLGLSDTPASFGTAGQVLAVNSGGTALEFVTASSGGGGGGISVGTRTGTTDNDDLVTGVTELRFAKAPFTVSDLGSGKVLLLTESSFNPIQVNGAAGVTASGEETLNLVAGDGITITADNTSSPKKLTFTASGGGGGGGGATTLGDLTDVDLTTTAPTSGKFLKYNGTSWIPASAPSGGGGGGGGDGTAFMGDNSRGTYEGGLNTITTETQINDAIDALNIIMTKLAPPTPPPLSTITNFALAYSYAAKQSGTNTSISVVTDNPSPPSTETGYFYDGATGTLTFKVDGVADGSRALTTNDYATNTTDIGTYGGLTITQDNDPYAGADTGANFWERLKAKGTTTTALSVGEFHTYQLTHSSQGSTNLLEFFVDNPGPTGASGASVDSSEAEGNLSYVSGVPSFKVNSNVYVSATISGAVGKCYSSFKVADISGTNFNTKNIGPDPAGYAEGDDVTFSNQPVSIKSFTFSDAGPLSLAVKGYNSKGSPGTPAYISVAGRVDTVSNEANRKTSGLGEYPSSGYGDAYDSTVSITSGGYADELQMLNGKFQYPVTDYSSNALAGPNYSGQTNLRWVTFAVTGPNNKGNANLNITATGLSAKSEQAPFVSVDNTGDIRVQMYFPGTTGNWHECNRAWSPAGYDGELGFKALNASSTTNHLQKKLILSNNFTCSVAYVRIGLASGSTATITSVAVSF